MQKVSIICCVLNSMDMKFLFEAIFIVIVLRNKPRLCKALAILSYDVVDLCSCLKHSLYFGNVSHCSFHAEYNVLPGFVQVVIP